MRARCGVVLLVTALTAGAAEAQKAAKLPRIGWLTLTGMSASRQEAFPQGLRELGYVDGRNLVIEHRSASGKADRLPALATELVQLRVNVLVALEPPAVRAAKNATKTIPIIMRSTDDPVELGWVASLARPGGNITGVTSYSTHLTGKRIELLLEMVPRISRIAVLRNPVEPDAARKLQEAQVAARELGVQLQLLEVRSPNDFDAAFEAAVRERADAVLPLRSPLIVFERRRIADLALKAKLPAIYDDREFVEAGGLMSYGANLAESYRRAAFYVDKILKGASPAELPVEQPTRFELWVNLKTASQIGFTFPPEVLLRADKVIR